MLPVTMDRSTSDSSAVRRVLLVAWMMSCLANGANVPKSWMTRMFCPVHQVVTPVGCHRTCFGWDCQVKTVKKVKVGFFYSATYAAMPRPVALYHHRKWQLIGKSQWCDSAMLHLQHTPPPQSTTPGLHPLSTHQMAWWSKHLITAYYSVYRPWKDERLNRPGWLVTYRNNVPSPGVEREHVTHPSTNRARRRVTSLRRPTPLRHDCFFH